MDPSEWRSTVGAAIKAARLAKGYSKRKAAGLAGFNEAVWRHIEEGERSQSGVMVAVNPRDETLAAAAIAVGLDPEDVFRLAQRVSPPSLVVDVTEPSPPPWDRVLASIDALSDEVQSLREEVAEVLRPGGVPSGASRPPRRPAGEGGT